jgi:CDP-paratose 2-epimerase
MDTPMNRRILITGSSGLVGSACMELFIEKGWYVTGIDNNGRSKFFGTEKRPVFNEIDIRDEVAINKLFSEKTFDAIIHAAGQPSHDYATDHVLEDFDINARGTLILLEATRKYCPEAVFVYVSTDKVYGENMKAITLQEETMRYQPWGKDDEKGFSESLGLDFAGDRSFFGCSKAAADMYAQQYAARFGMKVGVFRPGCITGRNHAGAEQHGFLAYLAKCIKGGKTYKIYGNGKQVRDQIHSSDLASALYEFIQSPKVGGVYNIGGGPERSVSVLEAGTLLGEAIGRPFIKTWTSPRKGDRLWDVHDVSKFRRDYPEWDYKYALSAIIKDLV